MTDAWRLSDSTPAQRADFRLIGGGQVIVPTLMRTSPFRGLSTALPHPLFLLNAANPRSRPGHRARPVSGICRVASAENGDSIDWAVVRRTSIRAAEGGSKAAARLIGWRMSEDGEYFRAGVGAIILDDASQVLALERSDASDAWQLPQGGLRRGEHPRDAVFREIEEETGIGPDRLELTAEMREPLAYELPAPNRSEKTGRGQVNYWFVLRLNDSERSIHPPPGEFRRARWMPFEQLVEEVVDFRRPVYRRLLEFLQQTSHASGVSRGGGRSP